MQLHPDLKLSRLSQTVLQITWLVVQQKLTSRSAALLDAVEKLAEQAFSEAELVKEIEQREAVDWTSFYYILNRLRQFCFLQYTLYDEQTPIADFRPYNPRFTAKKTAGADDPCLGLSRFALCRREEGQTVLESPLAAAQVTIHQPALLAPLWDQPLTANQYAEAVPTVSAEIARQFWGILAQNGFLTAFEDDQPAEEQNAQLYQWTFHDLLFHQRSRNSQYQLLTGKPRSFPAHIAPQPAFPPPMSDQVIPLPKPDPAVLRQQDRPFIEVVENRATTRCYHDSAPITREALAELLYRAARAKGGVDPATESRPYEISRRTYPGGGATYELEIYLAVRLCDGLEAGFYHYRPLEHALEYLSAPNQAMAILLEHARLALIQPAPPQIHLTFAARFQRVSWKYDPIAYALMLKNVGVLIHHLMLNANAMGLGFSPIGSGHTESFFEMLPNCDPLAQGPVGEAALGSLA